MNVTYEEAEHCEGILGAELGAEEVEKEWKRVVDLFATQAKLPGFRPGKAPRSIIESRFARQIQEELLDRLTNHCLKKAIEEKKLQILNILELPRQEIDADRTFHLQAKIVTEPDFTLPDYENITLTLPEPKVSDEEFAAVLNQVREPHASYPAVEDRGAEKDDFAVITYEATIGGKPLKEEIPTAPPILQGRANFWVQINEQSFLPAFTDALTGLKPGEKKTVTVPLPADYSVVELQGKTLDFHVTLEDLHLRELPEWDDELAGQIAPGKTLEEVRTLVRENLERAAKERFEANKRSEIIRILTSQITCPLPRRMLAQETTAILRDVIQENQSRGVSEEELREHTESLVGMARESAEQRVRSRFLLLRLAEKEKLQVHDQEVISHLVEISARHNIAPKKLIKDMQKRNALSQVRDDILARKALEFLAGKAVVQSAAA